MDFLIDSNILIYSYNLEYEYLRDMIVSPVSAVSEISRVEVLGYHGLHPGEEAYFKDIFNFVPIILPDQEIFNKAIDVRKQYNLKLGDSLIAATALIYNLKLFTRNLKDFVKIDGLTSIDPIKRD